MGRERRVRRKPKKSYKRQRGRDREFGAHHLAERLALKELGGPAAGRGCDKRATTPKAFWWSRAIGALQQVPHFSQMGPLLWMGFPTGSGTLLRLRLSDAA